MLKRTLPLLALTLTFAGGLSAQPATRLAANRSGHTFEYAARADQNGDNATLYGYLTRINGLDDAALFSPPVSASLPPRGETNARFTFINKLTFTNRFVNSNLVISNEDETMTIYFDPSPAPRDFTKPATFTTGAVIATFSNRVQTILNVQTPLTAQSPGRGIIQGTTEATQETANRFTWNDQTYVFGRNNHTIRMVALGQGTLTSASPFIATFVLGGYGETISRNGNGQ